MTNPLKRLCLAKATIVASLVAALVGCEGATVSPTPPASSSVPPAFDLTGNWVGQYEEMGCQSAVCPVCCTARGKGAPRISDLTLTVSQSQGSVTGLWRGFLSGSFAGELRGTEWSLRGSLSQADATGAVIPGTNAWLLADFSAQLNDPNTADGGTFVLVERDASGQELMRLSNRLVTMRRR